MNSPYADLPARSFWRSAVTDRAPLDPGDVYLPRFRITRKMKIATAGSCFAQHVGRTLKGAGFSVIDTEPAPEGMAKETAQQFGYAMYSARYGNIYTARQLVQLLDEAEGRFTPVAPVWEKNGRFYDALRPSVEPEGLESPDEVMEHRKHHLAAVLKAMDQADVIVFTFGLTEAWVDAESGTVYPTAPGTIAGSFDPKKYVFKNYSYGEIINDFIAFRKRMMERNPGVRFLITVSPVPLTATASGQHVEVATCYSKSVLRAVCGRLYEMFQNVDYYPSYEIITSQNAHGVYYEANKRNVSKVGVATAMGVFLAAHGAADGAQPAAAPRKPAKAGAPKAAKKEPSADDVVCEEALLDAFRK